MADVNGTENADFIRFIGSLQNLTFTMVNPYSGESLEIDAEFLVNSQSYDGLGGFDYLMLGNAGDALFLDGSSRGGDVETIDRARSIQSIEFIIAGDGGDIVNLASYINTLSDIRIDGGGGGDILWTNQGDDVVSGHDGNDHIVTGAGNDHLKGLNDDDYLNGGIGSDLLEGGRGDDQLKYTADGLWSAQDALAADLGHVDGLYSLTGLNQSYDSFRGDDGYDVLILTEGSDALLITDFNTPRHSNSAGDRLSGIERIDAGAGDDVIDLANSNIYDENIEIYGDDGDDFLRSGTGDDLLYGGEGNDMLYGGAGHDILYGGHNEGGIEVLEHLFNDAIVFPELHERQNIKNLLSPGDPALGISAGDLSVEYSTTATFTFQESGAGYRNTLGFYRINHVDGTIEGVEIGFANVKAYQAGTGYTVNLPGAPDSDFGFFIIANGYTRNQSYNGLDMQGDHLQFIYDYGGENERAASIFDDGDDISLIYDDGTATAVNLKGEVYHTTDRGGDTALNKDEADHVISGVLNEEDSSILRIGFEDLKNLGDADYNDVVFDLEIAGQTIDTSEQGNDTLVGGAGDDQLYGEGGDDVLVMGEGADIAYGGSGRDIFAFDVLDNALDVIGDYNRFGDVDIIDISAILEGYDPLSAAIEDFVQLSNNDAGDTLLEVHNGTAFMAVVQITGGTGDTTLQDMISDGSLIVDHA
tara:strand:- start:110711 stop:112807 length:2097 start_codon:yes stop_codon:yes gene_type:complete